VLDGKAGLTPATSRPPECPTAPCAHCGPRNTNLLAVGRNIRARPLEDARGPRRWVSSWMPGSGQDRRKLAALDGGPSREAQPKVLRALKGEFNGGGAVLALARFRSDEQDLLGSLW